MAKQSEVFFMDGFDDILHLLNICKEENNVNGSLQRPAWYTPLCVNRGRKRIAILQNGGKDVGRFFGRYWDGRRECWDSSIWWYNISIICGRGDVFLFSLPLYCYIVFLCLAFIQILWHWWTWCFILFSLIIRALNQLQAVNESPDALCL